MKRVERYLVFTSLVLILLTSSGCSSKSQSKSSEGRISTKSSVYNSQISESTKESEVSDDKSYYILKNVIKSDNIDASYPVIEGLNSDVQSIWNAKIYDRVSEYIRNVGDKEQLTLTYDIMTESSDMLSIVFRGTSFVKETANQYRFIYSYNIDLTIGNNIRFADNHDLERTAYCIFNGIDYTVEDTTSKENFESYIDNFYVSSTEVKGMLEEFDYVDADSYPEGYSYYHDGKVYLGIEVNHALGDYVIISFPE